HVALVVPEYLSGDAAAYEQGFDDLRFLVVEVPADFHQGVVHDLEPDIIPSIRDLMRPLFGSRCYCEKN
ncbi:MAG: hypothetical protein AAB834_04830, partial [Patescibacteria group bacterium]